MGQGENIHPSRYDSANKLLLPNLCSTAVNMSCVISRILCTAYQNKLNQAANRFTSAKSVNVLYSLLLLCRSHDLPTESNDGYVKTGGLKKKNIYCYVHVNCVEACTSFTK